MIKKLPARLLPRTLALGFAATVIAAAVLGITGVRMLPSLGDYRQEIEAWVAKSGGYPVMIGSIEASWHGIAPSIEVTDMWVLDHSRTRSLLRFARGSLRIDLVASLKQRRVIPDRLSLSGVSLTLVRTPEGKITVAGFTGNNDMARWLLQQRDLAIHWAQLVWHDQKAQRDPMSFPEVRLQSRHQQGRQVITGSVRLPPMMGSGEIKFRAKLAWAQARWAKLTGNFTAVSVKLASNTGRLNIREASGRFELNTINPGGWRLNVDQLLIATDRGRWPEKSHLTITVSDQLSRDTLGVRGYVSFLRLEDLAPLLAASPLLSRDLSDHVQHSQPTGDLRKTYIRYLPQRTGSERFSIHTQFSGVTTRASGKLPGIHTIAGTLKADAAGGLLHLSSSSAALDFNPLFKKPLPLNTLSGEIRWRKQGDQGWLISTHLLQASNRDLALKLSGDLIWTRAGNAIANLELAVDNGRIDQLGRYLPTVVPKQVRTWLGKALVGGQITSARAILRGPLDQFPFDRHQGRFSVRLQVSDGVLEYSTRWPRIEALATEIRFEGREMTLHAARGRTLEGIEILDTTARIADLGATQNHVQIHGHARGPTTKARDFIQHTPLKETIGQRIEPLTVDGNFTLDLGLKIPFADVKKTQLEGTVILPANTVMVKGMGLRFTRLRGSLVFTEETLTGKGLEAQLFNRPVHIDIESTKDDVWVILKGKADRAFLAERLAARGVSRLFERVKGETDWQAKLDLARPWNDPAGGENLEIRSSLIGLQIDAPAPLGKAYLGERRPFILKTSLAHAPARWVTLEYGEIFKAKLMLAGQSSSLRQASIQLGRRTVRPASSSARLWIGGRLKEFSLSQWTDFLDTVSPLLSSNPPAPHKLFPIGMDIVVSRLEGFGNWFNDIRLIANNALGTWRFKIDGKDAAGVIHVPSAKHVKAKLTRLILAHPATDTPTIAIEPARFPIVSMDCDRFVLKSFDLGKMALSMRPHPSGLRLESLTLTSPAIHIKAQGDWQSASGIPMSRFDISAQGPDLRGLLRRFNYSATTLEGGPTHIEIQARWPGTPADFTLSKLNGRLKLTVNRGQLLNVDNPIGRIFALLSIEGLRRRLSLDFNDLFRQGFSFDKLEGSFAIEKGYAYTNNLSMIGPSARIHISGRTGLVNQDYDQLVTVTPTLSSSLLTAGAFFGPVGAGVGATMLLAQQVFTSLPDRIDWVLQRQYTVTGSWNDPVVKSLVSH